MDGLVAPLAGAILCGGRSTRMGGDKATVLVAGMSLLDRAIIRLATVADPVILATGTVAVPHAGRLAVADSLPHRGPLGGLVAALRASPHRLCAVVAVDMPELSGELLRSLADARVDEDAVVPLLDGMAQPLHAVYATTALPLAEELLAAGTLSLRALLSRLHVRHIEVAGLGPGTTDFAVNLNTPGELTAWLRAHRRPRHAPR